MKICVAGATGMLGRCVAEQLLSAGHSVRALSRSSAVPGCEMWRGDLLQPATLEGLCTGQDAVISCAGAIMKLDRWSDRRSFTEVDYRGNVSLLREAERAGVGKFVYVSLCNADRLLHTEYARAHEKFVGELKRSKMSYAVLRPTGFFGFFREILTMAQKGRGIVVGKGNVRTNPIHEMDVANACIAALAHDKDELSVGGPRIYTREEIVRVAFASLGRAPSTLHVPTNALRVVTVPVALINPRIGGLMRFGIEVGLTDVVAPMYGQRTLEDYFAICSRMAKIA